MSIYNCIIIYKKRVCVKERESQEEINVRLVLLQQTKN